MKADPHNLPPHLQTYRSRYVAMANTWTRAQAERLRVSEVSILAAIKRGWIPEYVERVPAGSKLAARVFSIRGAVDRESRKAA